MNDEMEGFDLYEVLTDYLGLNPAIPEQASQAKFLYDTVHVFLRWQLCFSASTLKDNIGQWRAYAPSGRGICIEFSDGFLPNILKRTECLYNIDEKREYFQQTPLLNNSGKEFHQQLAEPNGVAQFISQLLDALVRFKNPAFAPENEVRWVLSLNGLSDPRTNLKYREHRLGLISYQPIEVNLDKVVSITLGPSLPEHNKQTVEDLLIQHKCAGFVKQSDVKLR